MNQEQLENLPYPMFETTKEEKEFLELAATKHFDTPFLCVRLSILNASLELRNKAKESLKDYDILEYFLFGGADNYGNLPKKQRDCIDSYEGMYKLRNIWIRKLLAYKPE